MRKQSMSAFEYYPELLQVTKTAWGKLDNGYYGWYKIEKSTKGTVVKNKALRIIKTLKIKTAVIISEYQARIEKGTFSAEINLSFLGIDPNAHEIGTIINLEIPTK